MQRNLTIDREHPVPALTTIKTPDFKKMDLWFTANIQGRAGTHDGRESKHLTFDAE
jgi:hypothetical protein